MKIFLFIAALLALSSCDYVERKTFRIKDQSGNIIKLTCPVVSPSRSTLTYVIDGHCVIEVE